MSVGEFKEVEPIPTRAAMAVLAAVGAMCFIVSDADVLCSRAVFLYLSSKGGLMAKNEKTSPGIARLAAKGLKAPSTLSNLEIKKLAASALTQTKDRKK